MAIQATKPASTSDSQTEGRWHECVQKGVRIGGGYHVYMLPKDRSESPSRPAQEFSASVRNTDIHSHSNGLHLEPDNQWDRSINRHTFHSSRTRRPTSREGSPERGVPETTLRNIYRQGYPTSPALAQQLAAPRSINNCISELEECAEKYLSSLEQEPPKTIDTDAFHTGSVGGSLLEEVGNSAPRQIDHTDWVDHVIDDNTVLPGSIDTLFSYNSYGHGQIGAARASQYDVGVFAHVDTDQQALSRKAIAEAVRSGNWSNVQLFRVLADNASSVQQGAWRPSQAQQRSKSWSGSSSTPRRLPKAGSHQNSPPRRTRGQHL